MLNSAQLLMALFTGSQTWLGHDGGRPKPVPGSQIVGMTRRCVIWEKLSSRFIFPGRVHAFSISRTRLSGSLEQAREAGVFSPPHYFAHDFH